MGHCFDDFDLISRYLDGEVAARTARWIEAHLAICMTCQREIELLRRLDRCIIRYGERTLAVPYRVEARILDDVAAHRRTLLSRFVAISRLAPAALGTMLAALLLFVGANIGLLHGGQEPSTGGQQPTPSSTVQHMKRSVTIKILHARLWAHVRETTVRAGKGPTDQRVHRVVWKRPEHPM
jgi:anti-sigma factor RsiW